MKRVVICGDSLQLDWARYPELHQSPRAIITSLPDMEDMKIEDPDLYEAWFRAAARQFMMRAMNGAVIFYQTDRKRNGRVLSKAGLLLDVANKLRYQAAGAPGSRKCNQIHPVWHKIAMTSEPGKVSLYRPGYSHLIAFSAKFGSGKATPDVFPAGAKVYPNGMGRGAAQVAVQYCRDVVGAKSIVDPMCGRGTVLAVANALGLDSFGIDIDPGQVNAATYLELTAHGQESSLPFIE